MFILLMMNKVIFTVALIIGLSFGIQTFAAQNITPQEAATLNAKLEQIKDTLVKLRQSAAQSNQSAPLLISKDDTVAINKGLEALKNVLVEMNSALAAGKLSETDKKVLSVALSGIVNSVATINASLKNRSLPALAESPPPQKSTILTENKPKVNKTENFVIPDKKQTDESFSEQTEQTSADNKQASLIDALRVKKSLWPAIIISLVAAASIWFGRKKLFELKTKMARLYSKTG